MTIIQSQIKLYSYDYQQNIETIHTGAIFKKEDVILNTSNFISNLEIPYNVLTDAQYLDSWNKSIAYVLKSLSDLDEFFYCKMSFDYTRTNIFRLVTNKDNWYYAIDVTLERI